MPGGLKNKGFTLIEVMVALALFIGVLGMALGIFSYVLRVSRYTASITEAADNVRFVYERISKVLRVGVVIDPDNTSDFNLPVETNEIKIKHPIRGTLIYRFDGTLGQVFEDTFETGTTEALTSPNISIEDFKFVIQHVGRERDYSGYTTDDNKQPILTMVATIKGKGSSFPAPPIRIQVSLSQRCLEWRDECAVIP